MKRTSIIAFLLALAACNPAALRPDGPERGEGESVSVALHLGVAPLEPGTPDTKVDREPDLDGGADWQEIRNVALMQFEWVDDDPDHVLQAQLVGQKQYFDPGRTPSWRLPISPRTTSPSRWARRWVRSWRG